jgi:hypothetical protein
MVMMGGEIGTLIACMGGLVNWTLQAGGEEQGTQ